MDAYAGTGAVGIEALSRGARRVYSWRKIEERWRRSGRNLTSLGAEARAGIIPGAASSHLKDVEADIVFLDPPYDKEREYSASLEALQANPPKLTIVQHSVRFSPSEQYGPLMRGRVVKQGDNALSFYSTG